MINQRGSSMEPYSAFASVCGELRDQILAQSPQSAAGKLRNHQPPSLDRIKEKLAGDMEQDQL